MIECEAEITNYELLDVNAAAACCCCCCCPLLAEIHVRGNAEDTKLLEEHCRTTRSISLARLGEYVLDNTGAKTNPALLFILGG